jgi:hypothetical protein
MSTVSIPDGVAIPLSASGSNHSGDSSRVATQGSGEQVLNEAITGVVEEAMEDIVIN